MLIMLISRIGSGNFVWMSKENDFDGKASGRKSARDKFPIRLRESTAIMASGFSRQFQPEDPSELCDGKYYYKKKRGI